MTNPLVAEPEAESPGPDLDGAGVASSWADLIETAGSEHIDPFEVTFAAAGAGLDTLGAVLTPLDSLLQAGIGWLIEHVDFLREPLDALAGNPENITLSARTWHNVATEMRSVAAEYRTMAKDLPGWDGAAGDAYRAAVTTFSASLDSTARNAEQLSTLIMVTGAAVGTVRSLIRDLIAEFCAIVVEWMLAWLALALVTAGFGIGGAVLTIVTRALELAENIARRISDLLDALSAAGGTAGQITDAMRSTAAQVRAATPGLRAAGEAIEDAADGVHAGNVIESGKELTGGIQDQRGWEDPSPPGQS